MPRLFVAVELPEGLRARLGSLVGGIPGCRWVPEHQLHLTLRFIGEVGVEQAADIDAALAGVRAAPFTLEPRGLGHFPPRGRPRVLWAGLEPSEGLARLRRRVEQALAGAGIPPDQRRFSPHITLARLSRAPAARVADFLSFHGDFAAPPFTVRSFALYSSVLHPKGARHHAEARYLLDGPGQEDGSLLDGTGEEA